ncbi:sensor histidine kinase [Ornithinimicrobium cryptoxanthini]|uniref:histidine kinase n=1 Tax=Ornithinimicrobium cryptoxanthini TaxID=2934161 RepID=A0ABY4YIM6_9MICO|nr:histidine kinase [Ornithinimicrobium cryptoxanthini]USQ76648.1 histidine kinase [Ornithinimicrobium cryptoxanthini]
MQTMSTRASWWMTAASYVWVWGVTSVTWPDRPWLCLGVSLWFGLAAWVVTRAPWPGVVLTAVGLVGLGLLGIGPEAPVPMGPLFIAAALLGYQRPPIWSVWSVPILVGVTATFGHWELQSIVFGTVLLFIPWWFGVQVRVRDDHRRRAAEDARRLAKVDPVVQAQLAAATERDGVAASAFRAIDQAVEEMTGTARSARATLEAGAIDAIHRSGEMATQRLRDLLVVLREAPPAERRGALDDAEDGATAQRQDRASRHQRAVDLGLAALVLLDVLAMPLVMSLLSDDDVPAWPSVPFLLVVIVPLMVAVGVRGRFPVAAQLGAAGVLLVGTAAGVADLGREGLWLTIVGVALSWSAGRAGTQRVLLAWLAFSVTTWAMVWLDMGYYLWIYLAMHLLTFAAAAIWSGHHAAETAHLLQVLDRQSEIADAEHAAVSRERLQLARDLHDAASHAVGTMMMQANAARVLLARDPDGARAALDAVVEIGGQATQELRVISTTADGSAGDSATAAGLGVGLSELLAPHVAAARRAGVHVSTSLDLRSVPSPRDAHLLVRVLREGLANAVRHAPGSEVVVRVSSSAGELQMVITNGPAPPVPGQDVAVTTTTGSGLGLRGLQELVGEARGELVAGAAGAGYELRASFPEHRAASETAVS